MPQENTTSDHAGARSAVDPCEYFKRNERECANDLILDLRRCAEVMRVVADHLERVPIRDAATAVRPCMRDVEGAMRKHTCSIAQVKAAEAVASALGGGA